MQKDGEPSVEDILRSIKKVISRDDEARPSVGYTPSFAGSRPFAPREAFQRDAYQGDPYTPPAATPEPVPEPQQEPLADLAPDDESDVYDLGDIPVVAPSAEDANDTPPAVTSLRAPQADNDAPEAERDADDVAPEPLITAAPGPVTHEPEAVPQPASASPAPAPAATDEGLIAGSAAAVMRERLSALSSLSAAAPRDEAPAHPLEAVVRDMLRPLLKDWLDANLEGIVERMVQDEITRITGRR